MAKHHLKAKLMAPLFRARGHKMSARWAGILDRRSWCSTTPESFRKALAAWHWAQTWSSMPPDGRPNISQACLTDLVPVYTVIVGPDNVPYMSLEAALWGVLVCNLLPTTASDCPGRGMWSVGHDVSWLHICDPLSWQVLPFTVWSPLNLRLQLYGAPCRTAVVFRQCGDPIPLLRHVFLAGSPPLTKCWSCWRNSWTSVYRALHPVVCC